MTKIYHNLIAHLINYKKVLSKEMRNYYEMFIDSSIWFMGRPPC